MMSWSGAGFWAAAFVALALVLLLLLVQVLSCELESDSRLLPDFFTVRDMRMSDGGVYYGVWW